MSEASTDADSEHALAEHIRAERVRFVFIQSALPIVFSPIAAVVLAVSLWNAIDHRRLVWFIAGAVTIGILRIATTLRFRHAEVDEHGIRSWETFFVVSIMAVDLWWGAGCLMLLKPGDPLSEAVVFAFVMLMAGGHVASYSAHPFTVLSGLLCLTVPITVRFALQPDVLHRALAFVSVMYVVASLRSIRTLGYFFGRTFRLAHELKEEKRRAEHVARMDFLTGLENRRAFYEDGELLLATLERGNRRASVVMLDIDHFKSINDRFGHAGGDEAIRAFAALIRAALRDGDIAGRLGGEEFAILFLDLDGLEARAAAERLRERVVANTLEFEGKTITFTSSFGVAEWARGVSLDAWIARADAALYDAKQTGRNKVVMAPKMVSGSIRL